MAEIPSKGFKICRYLNPDSVTLKEAERLSVKSENSWSYMGHALNLDGFPTSLLAYTEASISGDLLGPLRLFLAHIHEKFLDTSEGCNSYWITIRATTESDEWDIPRWHMDGNYFQANENGAIKLATVFTGHGTIFQEDGDAARTIYGNHQNHLQTLFKSRKAENVMENEDDHWYNLEDELRPQLGEALAHLPIASPGPGEYAVFRVGSPPPNAAVHSEPPTHEDRIFISVLPGTEAQVRELAQRWGDEFVDEQGKI
jgi:hypothetical protein